MEFISQKNLDNIETILKQSNVRGSKQLAGVIKKADLIPKLYVYAYIQSLYDNLKDISNYDDLEAVGTEIPKLQLYQIQYAKTRIDAVKGILHNAVERKGQFCDFDDSRYHSMKKTGSCENEDHSEWSEEDEEELPNENLELTPVFQADEDTHKYTDEPEWWCKKCLDNGEFEPMDVSCDMETE